MGLELNLTGNLDLGNFLAFFHDEIHCKLKPAKTVIDFCAFVLAANKSVYEPTISHVMFYRIYLRFEIKSSGPPLSNKNTLIGVKFSSPGDFLG